MPRLEVWDRKPDSSVSDFDLERVLYQMPPTAHSKGWQIFDLWVTGTDACGVDIPVPEAQTKEKSGLSQSWQKLLEISANFSQVIDAVFVGSEQSNPIRAWPPVKGQQRGFIYIEVVDSTFWALESDMEDVLDVVRSNYRDVREVATEHS
jgi:hypothetical protein